MKKKQSSKPKYVARLFRFQPELASALRQLAQNEFTSENAYVRALILREAVLAQLVKTEGK